MWGVMGGLRAAPNKRNGRRPFPTQNYDLINETRKEGQTKMTILEKLYYGEINPDAKQFERNSEYGRTFRKIEETEETLLSLLHGKEKELFQKNTEAHYDFMHLSDIENFLIGFKLGLRIGMEAMQEGGVYLTDIK